VQLGTIHPRIKSILIVDDEEDIRESLGAVLEAHIDNVTIYLAGTGTEGLATLKEHPVDLILSDYKMPGMDGLEFLTKAGEACPGAPRILITAYPELNVAMRAINEASISNFLTKPVSAETLIETINAAMVKSRAVRQ